MIHHQQGWLFWDKRPLIHMCGLPYHRNYIAYKSMESSSSIPQIPEQWHETEFHIDQVVSQVSGVICWQL
jgi:hypothetical protein